jgi:hypothetical protein
MVCKFEQVPPEIRVKLPVESKKLLLNKRKRQQEEDDSKKTSLGSGAMDIAEIPDKNINNSNILNQYEKFKNSVKGEEEIQDDNGHTYGFIDEYLEEAINTSKFYESTQETD